MPPKTTVCTTTFTEMWVAGTPTRIIAQTLRISADRCDTTRKQLGLPPRESWHGSKTGHRKAYLPTTTEIKEACERFQAGWTDEERARRLVGYNPRPDPLEVPTLPDAVLRFGGDDEDAAKNFLEDLMDTSGGGGLGG